MLSTLPTSSGTGAILISTLFLAMCAYTVSTDNIRYGIVRCDLQPLATWADTGYVGVPTGVVNSCSNSSHLSFDRHLWVVQ